MGLRVTLFVLAVAAAAFALDGWAATEPAPMLQNTWHESFPDREPTWKGRFFYRYTNAESYYFLTGNRADIRPKGQQGLWLSLRGVRPTATPHRMRLLIKPGMGAEASHISFGLCNHLPRLTVRFIDHHDRVFAISCVPKTKKYYDYIPIAIPLRDGLKAIEFDGHGRQVPGNINFDDVRVTFGRGPVGPTILHELQGGHCVVTR